MIPTAVTLELDEKALQEFILKQLDQSLSFNLHCVDLKRLSEILCMSERYIEQQFLQRPEVRIHERRNNRKRWWVYKPTIEAIEKIMRDWD